MPAIANMRCPPFAVPGYESRHNLNYWGFGDYVGLGAGAHGKDITATMGGFSEPNGLAAPADYLALITDGSMPAPPRGKTPSASKNG